MKCLGLNAVALILVSFVGAIRVTFDTVFDNPQRELRNVACGGGENGIVEKFGYKIQGKIPNYPLVGGTSKVEGYNSTHCGGCYSLTFDSKMLYIVAIDSASPNSFNIAKAAMNILTNNQAEKTGVIDAEWAPARPADCHVQKRIQ